MEKMIALPFNPPDAGWTGRRAAGTGSRESGCRCAAGMRAVQHQKREGSAVQIHVTRVALSHASSLAFPGLSSISTLAQRPQGPALAPQSRASQAHGTAATPQRTRRNKVSITGYRPGLQFATGAKRDSTASTDSIFVKGRGKFPDSRIGERSTRIPGLQSNGDVSGVGLEIAIRGRGGRFPSTLHLWPGHRSTSMPSPRVARSSSACAATPARRTPTVSGAGSESGSRGACLPTVCSGAPAPGRIVFFLASRPSTCHRRRSLCGGG